MRWLCWVLASAATLALSRGAPRRLSTVKGDSQLFNASRNGSQTLVLNGEPSEPVFRPQDSIASSSDTDVLLALAECTPGLLPYGTKCLPDALVLGVPFMVIAVASGRCLDDGGGTSNGASEYTLATCNPQSSRQIFTYAKETKLMRNPNTNLCVDDSGSSSQPFHMWECSVSNTNQLIEYVPETYQIKNPDKSECMEFDSASSNFYLVGCDSAVPNQRFDIVPVAPCPSGRVVTDAGECVVCGGDRAVTNGVCKCPGEFVYDRVAGSCGCPPGQTKTNANTCVCPPGQTKTNANTCVCPPGLLPYGMKCLPDALVLGVPFMVIAVASGRCLDDGGGTSNGASKYTLAACNTQSSRQIFTYTKETKLMRNPNTNLCVDDNGSSSQPFHMWECSVSNTNQHLEYVPETYQIKNPDKSKCMQFDSASSNFYPVGCDSAVPNQRFDIVPVAPCPSGRVVTDAGECVVCGGDRAVTNGVCKCPGEFVYDRVAGSCGCPPGQTKTNANTCICPPGLLPYGTKCLPDALVLGVPFMVIAVASGRCLDDGGGTSNGASKYTLAACNTQSSRQIFTYTKDTKLMRNRNTNLCVDDSGTKLSSYYMWECSVSNTNQHLEYVPETYQIKNPDKSKCMQFDSASSNFYPVGCDSAVPNQRFDIVPVAPCPSGRVVTDAGECVVCGGDRAVTNGVCKCPGEFVYDRVAGSCGCPPGQTKTNANTCVCPPGQTKTNANTCVCPPGLLPYGTKCLPDALVLGVPFMVIAVASGRCLDDGGGTSNGASKYTLAACNTQSSRQIFTYAKDTKLMRNRNTNLCVDDSGTKLSSYYMWECSVSNTNQHLEYVPETYQIKNPDKSKCMQFDSASSNFYPVGCDSAVPNQRFDIVPVAPCPSGRVVTDAGECVVNCDGDRAVTNGVCKCPGEFVYDRVAGSCGCPPGQTKTNANTCICPPGLLPYGTKCLPDALVLGVPFMVIAVASGRCLDDGGGTSNGASKYTLAACNTQSSRQIFTYTKETKLMRNPNTNLCVDDSGSSSQPFHMWECSVSNTNQHLEYVPETYQIKNPDKSKCMEFGSASSNFYLVGCDSVVPNQRFDIVPVAPCPSGRVVTDTGECVVNCDGDRAVTNGVCKCPGEFAYDRTARVCGCSGGRIPTNTHACVVNCDNGRAVIAGVCKCPPGTVADGDTCGAPCLWKGGNNDAKCKWTDAAKTSLMLSSDCTIIAPTLKDQEGNTLKPGLVVTLSASKKLSSWSSTATFTTTAASNYWPLPVVFEDKIAFDSVGVFELSLISNDVNAGAACSSCVAVVDAYPPTPKQDCQTSDTRGNGDMFSIAALAANVVEEDKFSSFSSDDNVLNNGKPTADGDNVRSDDAVMEVADFFHPEATQSTSVTSSCFPTATSFIKNLLDRAVSQPSIASALDHADTTALLVCERCCFKSIMLREKVRQYTCGGGPVETTLQGTKSCSFGRCLRVGPTQLILATSTTTTASDDKTKAAKDALPPGTVAGDEASIHRSIKCGSTSASNAACWVTEKLGDLLKKHVTWGADVASHVPDVGYAADTYVYWRYNVGENWQAWNDADVLTFKNAITVLTLEVWSQCGRVGSFAYTVKLHPPAHACATESRVTAGQPDTIRVLVSQCLSDAKLSQIKAYTQQLLSYASTTLPSSVTLAMSIVEASDCPHPPVALLANDNGGDIDDRFAIFRDVATVVDLFDVSTPMMTPVGNSTMASNELLAAAGTSATEHVEDSSAPLAFVSFVDTPGALTLVQAVVDKVAAPSFKFKVCDGSSTGDCTACSSCETVSDIALLDAYTVVDEIQCPSEPHAIPVSYLGSDGARKCVCQCPPGYERKSDNVGCRKVDDVASSCSWVKSDGFKIEIEEVVDSSTCSISGIADRGVPVPVAFDNYVAKGRINTFTTPSDLTTGPYIALFNADGTTPSLYEWDDYRQNRKAKVNAMTFHGYGKHKLKIVAKDYQSEASCEGCLAIIDKKRPTATVPCPDSFTENNAYPIVSSTALTAIQTKVNAFFAFENIVENDACSSISDRCDIQDSQVKQFFSDVYATDMSFYAVSTATAFFKTETVRSAVAGLGKLEATNLLMSSPVDSNKCTRCLTLSTTLKEKWMEYSCVEGVVATEHCDGASGQTCTYNQCYTVSGDSIATQTVSIKSTVKDASQQVINQIKDRASFNKDTQVHFPLSHCDKFASTAADASLECKTSQKLDELFDLATDKSTVLGFTKDAASALVSWRYKVDGGAWAAWPGSNVEYTFYKPTTTVEFQAWTKCGQVGATASFPVHLHIHAESKVCDYFCDMWYQTTHNKASPSSKELCMYPKADFAELTFDYHANIGLMYAKDKINMNIKEVTCTLHYDWTAATDKVEIVTSTTQDADIIKRIAVVAKRNPQTAALSGISVECMFKYKVFGKTELYEQSCPETFSIKDCTNPVIDEPPSSVLSDPTCAADNCVTSGGPGPYEACGGNVVSVTSGAAVLTTADQTCCQFCSPKFTTTCQALPQLPSGNSDIKLCVPTSSDSTATKYFGTNLLLATASEAISKSVATNPTATALLSASAMVALVALVVVRRRRAASASAGDVVVDDAYYPLLE